MLENAPSAQQAFAMIPEKEQRFLELVINYLSDNAKLYLARSQDLSFEYDNFLRKYTQLLTTLCSNYEYLFTADQTRATVAPLLFELLLSATRAKHLKLSFETLELWCELQSTLSQVLDLSLPEWAYLSTPYQALLETLLV